MREEEESLLFDELRGEDLALGFSERKHDTLVRVTLTKAAGGIRLEMDEGGKGQIDRNFKTRARFIESDTAPCSLLEEQQH